jgi:hypothetical protein
MIGVIISRCPDAGIGIPRVPANKDSQMKTFLLSAGFALLVAIPCAYAEPAREQSSDPCIHVDIQNDRVNRSSVRQTCDRNINRTVQAGEQNSAQTIQSGQVNDNKVRQYQYERSRYLDRLRGK